MQVTKGNVMTIYYTLADLSDGGKAHGGVAWYPGH